jgi:hypothetical protein
MITKSPWRAMKVRLVQLLLGEPEHLAVFGNDSQGAAAEIVGRVNVASLDQRGVDAPGDAEDAVVVADDTVPFFLDEIRFLSFGQLPHLLASLAVDAVGTDEEVTAVR